MSYIENTYICLIAPLLLAILCLRREARRSLLFVASGMTCCLLSAYVSTFIAGVLEVDLISASHEIAPVVEEIMKFLPMVFYVLVFEPEKKIVVAGTLLVAVGFATFENVCFVASYGTSQLLRLVIRGFGTGAMHVVCGVLVSVGAYFLWDRPWLRVVGSLALLCFVVTFHAIFNVVVNQTGIVFWIGSAVPMTLVLFYALFLRRRIERPVPQR